MTDQRTNITRRIVEAVMHHAEPGWCPACGTHVEQPGDHLQSCPIAEYVDQEQTARLRRMREARGLSLRDMESITGVSAATISRIERGDQPSLEVALKMARFYDTSVEDLFGEAAR